MAMVEFVLILPFLLMMLFAIVELAVMFGRWQTLSNAAREGARTAIVFRKDCTVGTVDAEVRQKVKDYAATLGIGVQDADINVTGTCGAKGTESQVLVNYAHTFEVLPGFARSLSPTISLVGSSTMRNEGNG